MAQRLPPLGGNMHPSVQIVLTQVAPTVGDSVTEPFNMTISPPISVPAGSEINVQGSVQLNISPTLSAPATLQIKVIPRLADVTKNKRHVDPVRPQWFSTDSVQTVGAPRYAYNATIPITTGCPQYSPTFHFGAVYPGGSSANIPQIAPDLMNFVSSYQTTSVFLVPNGGPSTIAWDPGYDITTSAGRALMHEFWGRGIFISPDGPGIGGSIGSILSSETTLDTILSNSQSHTNVVNPASILYQRTYVPYPTAVSFFAASTWHMMSCTSTGLLAGSSQIPYSSGVNADIGLPNKAGNPLWGYTPYGSDILNRLCAGPLWNMFDGNIMYDISAANYPSGTGSIQVNFSYGLPVAAHTYIALNAMIAPNSFWSIKLLPFLPILRYEDIFACSPNAKVNTYCNLIKSGVSNASVHNTFFPDFHQVFQQLNTNPKFTSPIKASGSDTTCPASIPAHTNTTAFNAPLLGTSYVTQFGAIIPWDWNTAHNNPYTTWDAAFRFRIDNSIRTFNPLTANGVSGLYLHSMQRFIKEYSDFSATGQSTGIVMPGTTFTPPPPLFNEGIARLFINQPGSFYAPFVTASPNLVRTTKPLEPIDISGNTYGNRTMFSLTASQDPDINNTGGQQQHTRRPNPTGGSMDFSPCSEFLSSPHSFLRVPCFGAPLPVTDVLWGAGRSVPNIIDASNPSSRPYNHQTYWNTITATSPVLLESGTPALALSRAALERMGTRSTAVAVNQILEQYWQTAGQNNLQVTAILPSFWWGYTTLYDSLNEAYAGGTYSSLYCPAYHPTLSTIANSQNQNAYVQTGALTMPQNTTTTPWGLLATVPMSSKSDLACVMTSSGTPSYSSLQPLLNWTGLYPYSNIGFTPSGGVASIGPEYQGPSLLSPNAGSYTVAGRSIVQPGWAHPFTFNPITGAYDIPWIITCNITVPAGKYTYASLCNVFNVAFSDPNCSYMNLTSNILDDGGKETSISGCLNAIGFDTVLHNVIWTNASNQKDSLALLPPHLSAKSLAKAVPSLITSDLEGLFPPDYYQAGSSSRCITAFRAANDVELSANLSLTWDANNSAFVFNGTTSSYIPTGGSGQGYNLPAPPSASFSSGWYTRCPADPQAIGTVAGVSSSNPNPTIACNSDRLFLANAFAYCADLKLVRGSYGPIDPLCTFSGAFTISDIYNAGFNYSEQTASYSGASPSMKGTITPSVVNSQNNWNSAAVAIYRALGSLLFMSNVTNASEYLYQSPIINPLRHLPFSGLSGITVLQMNGASATDKQFFKNLFGFQTSDGYLQSFETFNVAFSEGESYVRDVVTKQTGWVYNPNFFCFQSPLLIDSPAFTARLVSTPGPVSTTLGNLDPNFCCSSSSLSSSIRNGIYNTLSPAYAQSMESRCGVGGHVPLLLDRYDSLTSVCLMDYSKYAQYNPYYVDNNPEGGSNNINYSENNRSGLLPAGFGSWEQLAVMSNIESLSVPYPCDLLPIPAAYTMASALPPVLSTATRLYMEKNNPAAGLLLDPGTYQPLPSPYLNTNNTWVGSYYTGESPPQFAISGICSRLIPPRLIRDNFLPNIALPKSSEWLPDYFWLYNILMTGPSPVHGLGLLGWIHRDRIVSGPDAGMTVSSVSVLGSGASVAYGASVSMGALSSQQVQSGDFTAIGLTQLAGALPWRNAPSSICRTTPLSSACQGFGQYPGSPPSALPPVSPSFIYRSWPPLPALASPFFLQDFLPFCPATPATPSPNYQENTLGFQTLYRGPGFLNSAPRGSDGYLPALNGSLNSYVNIIRKQLMVATPKSGLASLASMSQANFWSPFPLTPPGLNPSSGLTNGWLDFLSLSIYNFRGLTTAGCIAAYPISASPLAMAIAPFGDSDLFLRLCANLNNLRDFPRSHCGYLKQTTSNSFNPDARLHWYLNTWQPPCPLTTQAGTSPPATNYPSGSCLPSTLTIARTHGSPVYGNVHHAFTSHAYRHQIFGTLQSTVIHADIQNESMEPPLRYTLGWKGANLLSCYPSASPNTIYWSYADSSCVLSSLAGSNTASDPVYKTSGVETNGVSYTNLRSMTSRSMAPLGYVPKDCYFLQHLLPQAMFYLSPCPLDATRLTSAPPTPWSFTPMMEPVREPFTIIACIDQVAKPISNNGESFMNLSTMGPATVHWTSWIGPTFTSPSAITQTCVVPTYCPPFCLTYTPFMDQMSSIQAPIVISPSSSLLNDPRTSCSLDLNSNAGSFGTSPNSRLSLVFPELPNQSYLQNERLGLSWICQYPPQAVLCGLGVAINSPSSGFRYNTKHPMDLFPQYAEPEGTFNLPSIYPPVSMSDFYALLHLNHPDQANTFALKTPYLLPNRFIGSSNDYLGTDRPSSMNDLAMAPALWLNMITNDVFNLAQFADATPNLIYTAPVVCVPEAPRVSALYPSSDTYPSTTYLEQTHGWSPSSGENNAPIMEFAPYRSCYGYGHFAYTVTPTIHMVIGRLSFNSSTYSSLGCYGPPSSSILRSIGYQLDDWYPAQAPREPSPSSLPVLPPFCKKPSYVADSDHTAQSIWKKLHYEQEHCVARRISFMHTPPAVQNDLPISFPYNPKNPYFSDPFSGPILNLNDSVVQDINPTLYPNPTFTSWDMSPTVNPSVGEIFLVQIDTIPELLSHRCDVRVNLSNEVGQLNSRFVNKEVLIPSPQPALLSTLADCSYSFTFAPPMVTSELTQISLSLTNLQGQVLQNVYAHNVSITVTPAVNAPQLSGYGADGEETNPQVPTLQYQKPT